MAKTQNTIVIFAKKGILYKIPFSQAMNRREKHIISKWLYL